MTDDTDLYDRFLTCLGLDTEPEKKAMDALNRLYEDNDNAMKTLADMKDFPDDLDLRIMWQVAVSSSISGQGEAYRIFARLLYQHLTDTGPKIRLDEPITKEQYSESKNPSG